MTSWCGCTVCNATGLELLDKLVYLCSILRCWRVFWQGDANAAAKFQEVSKAYDTLRDPQKRQQYDSMGSDNYERMAESGGAGFSKVGHLPSRL